MVPTTDVTLSHKASGSTQKYKYEALLVPGEDGKQRGRMELSAGAPAPDFGVVGGCCELGRSLGSFGEGWMFAVDKQMGAGLKSGAVHGGSDRQAPRAWHNTPGSAPSMQGYRGPGHLCVRGGQHQIATSHDPQEGAQPLHPHPHW